MRTIEVDDATARWIDEVKKSVGIIGVDHGKTMMCDDPNAILHMYVAWKQIRKIKEVCGQLG